MANQTFTYVSDTKLLYFAQQLKLKLPAAGAIIDDTVAALDKVYSSQKVETLVSGLIDDSAADTVTTNTYSAKKIHDIVKASAGAMIDDTAAATDKTYSSSKIETVAANAASAIIDDSAPSTSKVYSSDKIDALIGDIIDDASNTSTTSTWSASKIYSAISAITGVQFKKVATLPTTGESGVIYLVANQGTAPNIYDEYIWLADTSTFELIGTTEVDLSNYVEKTDLVEITTTQIDNIIKTVWGP